MFSDPCYYWFIAGILALTIEVLIASVVLLFVGLAAITVGFFLFFGIIEAQLIQLIIFAVAAVLWYLALAIPLRKRKISKLKDGYKDMSDQRAKTLSVLKKGKVGKALWSGVKMKAILSKNNFHSEIKKGQIVRVLFVEENDVLVVTDNIPN